MTIAMPAGMKILHFLQNTFLSYIENVALCGCKLFKKVIPTHSNMILEKAK